MPVVGCSSMFVAVFVILVVATVTSAGTHDGWFDSSSSFADEREKLEVTTKIVINSAKIDIRLPRLKSAKKLEIDGVKEAKTLDLPLLWKAKTISIKNNQLAVVLLPQLKDNIDSLEISSNPSLSVVDLGRLSEVNRLIIKANKKVPFDQFKWFFNPYQVSMTYRNQSHVECHLSRKDVFRSATFLHLCTHIHGPLIIKGPRFKSQDYEMSFQEIRGCVTIQGTQLKNLDFLRDTVVQDCVGGHRLIDNPRLCNRETGPGIDKVMDGETVIRGEVDASCDPRICTTGYEQGCREFVGKLIIDDATPADLFQDLEIIRGSLHISTIRLHSQVELPNLKEIHNFKGPLINIFENVQLTSIELPKLKNLTKITGEIFEIKDNSQDLKINIGGEVKIRSGLLEEQRQGQFTTNDMGEFFWPVVYCWSGLIVLLSCGSQIWYLLIWNEEYEHWAAIEAKKAEERLEMYKLYRCQRERKRHRFWQKKTEEMQKMTIATWQSNHDVKHITL